ncbi:hypothetical protein ABIB37_000234 [Agrococcus sp. UYP10]|uniref:hypothetical protein n=1 Tax=Agrococcus sp. UYP10 TaxID=1756355 RepID=UPI003395A4B2
MQLSAWGIDPRWPDDMAITIDDHPTFLLELLWIRDAYGLQPAGDAPPLLVDAPATQGTTPDAAVWEAAWPELWGGALRHAGSGIEPGLLEAIDRAALGSSERHELFERLLGPRWAMRFGGSALDVSFLGWNERHVDRLMRGWSHRHEDEPELKALGALIPAWRAGLTRIVTIPCHGEHTRRIGTSALLMTDATRADPARFAAALDTFR